MNRRRIALIGLNVAGGLGLLFALASNLSGVPDEEIRPPSLAAVPAATAAVTKQTHQHVSRILFQPVQENASKAAESTKPPFRLVGIISQGDESFAVVQLDGRNSVRLRLKEQTQGWRLEEVSRISARFTSKEKSVGLTLNPAD